MLNYLSFYCFSKTQIQFDMQPKVNATEESKANKLENKKSSDTTESEDNKQKISTDEAPGYIHFFHLFM